MVWLKLLLDWQDIFMTFKYFHQSFNVTRFPRYIYDFQILLSISYLYFIFVEKSIRGWGEHFNKNNPDIEVEVMKLRKFDFDSYFDC